MAGGGRYPNPDGERRNRAERAFDWTTLPLEGRPGPAPALPALRAWDDQTLLWWAALWATPQAVMWDNTGRTLHTLALLHHQLMLDKDLPGVASKAASIAAEMRQHEDRHGLTPKAMLQLRWRVSTTPADGSGKVLHLVPREVAERVAQNRPDPALMPAKRAPKSEWVDWAVMCGLERSTADKLSKPKLIAELSSIAGPDATQTPPPLERPLSRAAQRVRDAQKAKEPPKPGGRKARKR
jgi:hypothetical protein